MAVQDRQCVDELLALEEGKVKFAKRKLRLQRCKTLPGQAKLSSLVNGPRTGKTGNDPKSQGAPEFVPSIPKGDPSLGEKLASLSKNDRKKVKAEDADRIARRIAKKRARNALATEGVKIKGKERERVRKPVKPGQFRPKKEGKGSRVRSAATVSRRNTKK